MSGAARVRLYDAKEEAAKIRRTFTDKPVKGDRTMSFGWPEIWQHVGDSLAVAYASDKWKKDGDYELYKHLAESRNRALCRPEFLVDHHNPTGRWPTLGPMVSFRTMVMPRHFAVLGYFEEADLCLHTLGTDRHPEFGPGKNDGVVQVKVKHAKLGASKLRKGSSERPFLFVYTDDGGPLMFIVGDELDIEKDGIVG
jgi:hypothetical protein